MPPIRKVDLLRLHRSEYAAPRAPRLVVVGRAQYLSARGRGRPGCELFEALTGALRATARAVRAEKRRAGKDYRVMPLECLWAGSPGEPAGAGGEPAWKLLLRMPNFVTGRDVAAAAAALAACAPGEERVAVRLETLKEGRCIQAIHVGPCEAQGETLERMRRAARALGLVLHGLHHEVYLSDPRRVPPDRRRVILRRPARAAR